MKKLLLLLCTFLCSVGMWAAPGDEIKTPNDVVSGKTYYIKGISTVSKKEVTYYFKTAIEVAGKMGDSNTPNTTTNIQEATPVTFTKTGSNWTATIPNGKYLRPHSSNGQMYLSDDELSYSLVACNTKEGNNKGMKFGPYVNGTDNWYLQVPTSAQKIGGYKTEQYGFTLIEAEGSASNKETTSLSFAKVSYDVNIGESFVAPTLTATPNSILSSVTYSSNNTSVADVNSTTGAVTINGLGSATIKASYAGDATYKASTATYVINVVDPNIINTTFDLSGNKYEWGSTNDGATYFDGSTYTPAVEGDITLSVYGNVRMWGTTESSLRLYGDNAGTDPNIYSYGRGAITLKAAEGYVITSINFEGSNLTFDPNVGTYSSSTWTGKANAVTLVKGSNTPQIKKITVTYKEADYFSLTTADTDFYTLYLENAVTIPSGMTAYTGVLSDDKTVLTINEIEDVIPANTAVLVKGTAAKEYKFYETTTAAFSGENSLEGVATDTQISSLEGANETVLVLGMVGSQVGFAKPAVGVTTVEANKAYLKVSTSADAKVRISLGEATAIKTIEATTNNAVRYNLAGQRVNVNTKGIIIVNGKKVLK